MFQVFEFARVEVGNKQKVRAGSSGYAHGPRDGADTRADGGQQAEFEPVDGFVQLFELFVFWGLAVVLFGDRGVGFVADVVGCEGLDHCG